MKKIESLKFVHGESMNESEMKQITGGDNVSWGCYDKDRYSGMSYSTQELCLYMCSNYYRETYNCRIV